MSSSEASPPSPSPPLKGRRGLVAPLTRRLVLFAPLALAACGFAPALAPGGPGAALQGSVRATSPDTKNAFDLVGRIEERLGRPTDHRYDLAYTIQTETVGVGVTTDNKITRYNLKGAIDYVLTDSATGERLVAGRVQTFTAYAATGSTVAGLAAEEDAATRLMRTLADQIVTRLIAGLAMR